MPADAPNPPHRPTQDDRNDLVCFCMTVDRGTLRAAIARGARTIHELQDTTFACTGCGTCREDLLAMIAEAERPAPTATGEAAEEAPADGVQTGSETAVPAKDPPTAGTAAERPAPQRHPEPDPAGGPPDLPDSSTDRGSDSAPRD